MKRAILGICAALLICGCVAEKEEQYQEIRLMVSGVIGTKSAGDAVNAMVPTGVATLRLQGVDVATRVYDVAAGESVRVPLGVYRVSGAYVPTEVGRACYSSLFYEPSYVVSGDIVVQSGVGEYSVGAQYDCFAVVVDYGDAARVEHSNGADAFVALSTLKREGDYGVVFMQSQSASLAWYLRVFPQDEAGREMRQYILARSGGAGKVAVEDGKWYLLSTREVDKEDGVIGVILPGWQQGEVE